MRYLVVENGIIENIVEWDGQTPWGLSNKAVLAPDDLTLDIGQPWPHVTENTDE